MSKDDNRFLFFCSILLGDSLHKLDLIIVAGILLSSFGLLVDASKWSETLWLLLERNYSSWQSEGYCLKNWELEKLYFPLWYILFTILLSRTHLWDSWLLGLRSNSSSSLSLIQGDFFNSTRLLTILSIEFGVFFYFFIV